MNRIFFKIFINTLSIFIVAWMLSGIQLDNTVSAILVAIVLALFNTFLRPVLILLTVPLTLVSMGLSVLIINAVLIMLAGNIVPGFEVASFGTAFWFSILMSIVSFFLELPEKIRQNQIFFKRVTNLDEDPFFDETSQQTNSSTEFQDAEIIEDDNR
jgi:putative membrane protein